MYHATWKPYVPLPRESKRVGGQPVHDLTTGETYESIADAAEVYGVAEKTMAKYVDAADVPWLQRAPKHRVTDLRSGRTYPTVPAAARALGTSAKRVREWAARPDSSLVLHR